jgi:ATPase subunit of ABC transporter with duplicated ATPase domains
MRAWRVAAARPICALRRVEVIRCRRTVLRDVCLTITPRAKIGVVGPRGAGKSALLTLIAGVDLPAAGTVRLAPDVSVSVLAQDAPLDDTQTVWGQH